MSNQYEYLRRLIGIEKKEEEEAPIQIPYTPPIEIPTISKNIFIPVKLDFLNLVVEDVFEGAWTPLPIYGDVVAITADTDVYIGVGQGTYGFPLWSGTYFILWISDRIKAISAKAMTGTGKIYMQCFKAEI